MGVVISTTSELAPISIASITIGFISFAFTLGTFLKVVWVNLETIAEPAHGVHTMLNNLREELLEERTSLKVLKRTNKQRKKSRKRLSDRVNELLDIELDDVTLKTMSDSIRHLCRTFHQLERPFLKDGEDGMQQVRRRPRKRGDSPSPHYAHSAYASPPYEKRRGGKNEVESEDDAYWAQRVQYAPYGLRRRLDWLYHKSTALNLVQALSRIQTRRIARQVNNISLLLREYGDSALRMEDRLDRVAGSRRTDQ